MTWDQALREVYPELFSIVVDKEALVHSYLETSGEGGTRSWNPLTHCLIFCITTSQEVRELIVQIGDLLILKFFYVRSYYDAEGGCGGTIWLEQLVWQAW